MFDSKWLRLTLHHFLFQGNAHFPYADIEVTRRIGCTNPTSLTSNLKKHRMGQAHGKWCAIWTEERSEREWRNFQSERQCSSRNSKLRWVLSEGDAGNLYNLHIIRRSQNGVYEGTRSISHSRTLPKEKSCWDKSFRFASCERTTVSDCSTTFVSAVAPMQKRYAGRWTARNRCCWCWVETFLRHTFR